MSIHSWYCSQLTSPVIVLPHICLSNSSKHYTHSMREPKFGFHALRHAAASLFIEQGWPTKKVQSILGHSSITMTMDVYGHLFESPEDDVEMFEKMEADLMAA